MRKNVCFLVLIALFLSVTTQAQLFWKISGNGLAKPSYLFGSHHLIEKEKIPNFDKVLALIPQTDVVIGEMDMSNMLGMQLKMIKECIMKDTTMYQLLSDEQYKLVDTQLKEVVGKGLNSMGKMKPALLSSMYEVMLYMKQNNISKELEAVDIVFQKAGKKAKKKIIGLETIDQQIDILFNSKYLNQQAHDLVIAVSDKDKSIATLTKMNDAYLKGDLTAMLQLYAEQAMSEADKKVLVSDRNKNWVMQLQKIMPTQSSFVCVGCLHLVDSEGLIQLLRDAGYTVEPVLFN